MEGVESSLDKIVCSEARYSILIQLFLLVVAPSPSAGLLHQQLLQACALTSLTYNIYISLYSEVSISFISFLLLYFSVFCFFCFIYISLIFYYSCNPSCLFSSLFAIRIFFFVNDYQHNDIFNGCTVDKRQLSYSITSFSQFIYLCCSFLSCNVRHRDLRLVVSDMRNYNIMVRELQTHLLATRCFKT